MRQKRNSKPNMFLWGGVMVIIAAGILFFSFFYPLPDQSDTSGAMGGIEKAERDQESRHSPDDIVMQNKEVAAVFQSAEFQNIKNDPEARKILSDEKFVAAMEDESLRTILFDRDNDVIIFTGMNQFLQDHPQAVVFLLDKDIQGLLSPDMLKLIFSRDFNIVLASQEFQQWHGNPEKNPQPPQFKSFNEETLKLLQSNAFNDFYKVYLAQESNNPGMIFSQDTIDFFKNPDAIKRLFGFISFAGDHQLIVLLANDAAAWKTLWSQDVQKFLGLAYYNIPDPASLKSFHNVLLSQDFQNMQWP